MSKVMMNMEALENVNGGDMDNVINKADEVAKTVKDGVVWVGGKVVDGAVWVGEKVADGASWVWNSITSLF